MSQGPQRYEARGSSLEPAPDAQAVLFADIEPALRDSVRYNWLMPVLSGMDNRLARLRMEAIAAGFALGKRGNDLVDFAMEGCTA